MTATVEARVQYVEDPQTSATKQTSYSARMAKAFGHGAVGLSGAYAQYVGTLNDLEDRDTLSFTASGRYEISPRFNGTVVASADKVTGTTVSGFPYHFNGSARLSYGFNYDLTAALTYAYVDYRNGLWSSAGASQTNRVIVEVKKIF